MQDLSPSGCTVHLAQHHARTVLQGQHNRRTLDVIAVLRQCGMPPYQTLIRAALAERHAAGNRDLRNLIPTIFRLSNLAVNNARGSHGNDY